MASRHMLALVALLSATPLGGQRISISPSPTLTIGRGSDAQTQFTWLLGAWQMPNGDIVVAEPGAPAPLRSFKPDGRFSRVIARSGSGPGELGTSLLIATRAGSAIITHEYPARVSLFDVEKSTLTGWTLTLKNAPGRPVVQGMLAGGRWLVVGAPGPLRARAEGAYRDSTWFGVMNAGVDSVTVVGRAAREAFYVNSKIEAPKLAQRVRYDSLVPWTSILPVGDGFVIADPASGRIRYFDQAGNEVRSVESPFPASPYSRSELAKARSASLAQAKTAFDSGMRVAMYELSGRPQNAPRYKRVVPGINGELWVEKFWLDETKPREFAILSATGVLVSRVSNAPPVRYTEFGMDHAIGIAVDNDGVQTVQRFALKRD